MQAAMVGVVAEPFFSFLPHGDCFFARRKLPQVETLSVVPDLRSPSLDGGDEADPHDARGVVLPPLLVTGVFLVVDDPKVLDAIVESISVNVVDMPIWPLAIVHRPDDPVGEHLLPEDRPFEISV